MADSNEDVWVMEPERLQCLVSTTRMDIVDHLAGRGAPGEGMSVKQIAKAVGRRPSALYHHIEKLEAAGLIRECGSRTVNRKHEKLYETPSRRMRLKRALGEPANAEVMREIVASLARQASRDFSAGQQQDGARPDGPVRNLGFYRTVSNPSPERLARINALIEEIAELMWEEDGRDQASSPAGEPVVLTWVMAPLP